MILKNGNVFLEGELKEADILIDEGKIKKIGAGLDGDEAIDLAGKIVLPGMIDVHVHFREPGDTHKEDFFSGSKAAAAGGVTTILAMPNTNPPIISQKDIDNAHELAKKSLVNYGIYIGATPDNLNEINNVKNAVAIKAYIGSSTGSLLLDNVADFVKLLENTDKLVVVHAEDEELIKYFSKKHKSTEKHHKMRDNLAALSAVRTVLIANHLNKRVHIAHTSTKEEIDFLRKNKQDNITCEACPHHLFLNTAFFDEKGNFGKMNPPLRYEEDRKALWDGIKDGVIDIVSTDHAPHTIEEKRTEFHKAPCGVPGVQTMLPLLLNEVGKQIVLKDVVRLCSTNPAKIFGLENKGMIKEGYSADLIVVDMDKEKTIRNQDQLSKCGWTPFNGTTVKGWPIMTIVNGNIVFKDGEIIEKSKGMPVLAGL